MIPQAYFAGEDIRLDEAFFLFFSSFPFFFFLGLDRDSIDTIYYSLRTLIKTICLLHSLNTCTILTVIMALVRSK